MVKYWVAWLAATAVVASAIVAIGAWRHRAYLADLQPAACEVEIRGMTECVTHYDVGSRMCRHLRLWSCLGIFQRVEPADDVWRYPQPPEQ